MTWREEEVNSKTMEKSLNEQDPGRPKTVTNADEQDVAVNHSSKEEGGYDEPAAERQPASPPANEQSAEKEEVQKEKKPGKGPHAQSNKNF